MDKKTFLEKSGVALSQIYDSMENLRELDLSELIASKTALVIIDMINGFVKEGALYSPRNEALINPIAKLSEKCSKLGITKLAFADTHNVDCLEFDAYPSHCIKNTAECEIVSEIKDYTLIAKNSTNGFLEEKFQNWLQLNNQIDTFIVVGDCTDICIYQFVVTLKTYFNTNNIKSKIIVPKQLVNTFDAGLHYADLMHIMALFSMTSNGIDIVESIYYKN